ncbi:hypothetical protein FGB62_2g014 [Gracilaria domingensis]|nr:hypothetical protein FGB62_2g014 [Gracilaria domingensis]
MPPPAHRRARPAAARRSSAPAAARACSAPDRRPLAVALGAARRAAMESERSSRAVDPRVAAFSGAMSGAVGTLPPPFTPAPRPSLTDRLRVCSLCRHAPARRCAHQARHAAPLPRRRAAALPRHRRHAAPRLLGGGRARAVPRHHAGGAVARAGRRHLLQHLLLPQGARAGAHAAALRAARRVRVVVGRRRRLDRHLRAAQPAVRAQDQAADAAGARQPARPPQVHGAAVVLSRRRVGAGPARPVRGHAGRHGRLPGRHDPNAPV